jgi:hypothetical protein
MTGSDLMHSCNSVKDIGILFVEIQVVFQKGNVMEVELRPRDQSFVIVLVLLQDRGSEAKKAGDSKEDSPWIDN